MQVQATQDSTPVSNKPISLWGCGLGAALFVTLVLGVLIGLGLGRLSDNSARASQPAAANRTEERLTGNFNIFWEAVNIVYRDYYGELPTDTDVAYSAIRGVVDQLGDAHTSFMTPKEAEQFRDNLAGKFEGIGCRVDWDEAEKAVRIVEPFENQPAWEAGIRRNDLIIAINGESTAELDLQQAIQKIRGETGTTVILLIKRAEAGEPFPVEVTRGRVESPTVATKKLGPAGEIAYIQLFTFNENAGQLVRQAARDAQKNQPKAMILDLRGNGGGLLREAVKVSNVFVEDATILFERFRDGKTETYKTDERAIDTTTPLIVLIDEASASASEIVAGALHDLGRARLVGVTSFGKGSVQLPETLSDGSIIRVTVARWFTPNDHNIDGKGLEPDVRAEISEADRDAERDPQLEAAVQELLQ